MCLLTAIQAKSSWTYKERKEVFSDYYYYYYLQVICGFKANVGRGGQGKDEWSTTALSLKVIVLNQMRFEESYHLLTIYTPPQLNSPV